MNTTEVQALLDGLDRRVALGEIDIGTYNNLRAKFSAQLTQPKDPLADAFTALPKEAVALRCPGCLTSLPAPKDDSVRTLVCEYCGGSFTLQTAQAEMEALRGGIKKWISEIAGGAGSGSTVDEASRRFIFTEKLLPSLKMDADRTTEIYAFTRHQALFSFPLLDRLANSQFQQAVSSAPDLNYFVDRIKATIARVQAPEVQAFAVGASEKATLSSLEVQCQETIYLSNARKHLAAYTEDGFQKAASNLQAVETLYSKAQAAANGDPSPAARFAAALADRVKTAKEATEAIKNLLLSSDGLMADNVASQLDTLADRSEQAATKIEQSGREARETVPAAEGARTEAQTLRLLANCLRLFSLCGAETGESFPTFLQSLSSIIDGAKEPQAEISWLSDFLSRLCLHIDSLTGKKPLPFVDRFDWAEASATAGAKSFLFGGTEATTLEQRVLVPFWMARLCFSQQSGFIFKKGAAAESLLFLNASRPHGQCFTMAPTDALAADIGKASKAPTPLGTRNVVAIPVVTRESAGKDLKAFLSSNPEFAGGYADIQHLIYLPVAVAKYTSKKGERHQVMAPAPGCQLPPFQIRHTNLGTRKLALLT